MSPLDSLRRIRLLGIFIIFLLQTIDFQYFIK
jgi:hypothetical protein